MNAQYIKRLEKIEGRIRELLPSRPGEEWLESVCGEDSGIEGLTSIEELNAPCIDLLHRGGKRWRPMLMVLTAELFGREDRAVQDRAVLLSPLVELPHNGSLMIDDIEDRADRRRGKPAVHMIYGEDAAINSGNFLYFLPSLAVESASLEPETKARVYSLYMENMRRLHVGQGLDISWHNDHTRFPAVGDYMQMCRFKTGALARLSGQLGVLAAGGPEGSINGLGRVYEEIGVGFQIFDDIINLTTGNPGKKRGDDVVEGKKSLPFILHVRKNPETGERLQVLFQTAARLGVEKGSEAIEEAVALVTGSGSIEEARKTAEAMIQGGTDHISERFPPSEARDLILDMLGRFKKSG